MAQARSLPSRGSRLSAQGRKGVNKGFYKGPCKEKSCFSGHERETRRRREGDREREGDTDTRGEG